MTTITDLYEQYVTGCGQETPERAIDELRDLFRQSDSRYDDDRSIDAFWILVFGRDGDASDCWAWDAETYPSDAQWDAYHAAMIAEGDDD